MEDLRVRAERGDAWAQSRLANHYSRDDRSFEPEGWQKDPVLAYMWYNLAVAQGESAEWTVTTGYEHTKISKGWHEQKMTREQITEGQRLTREWIAAHPIAASPVKVAQFYLAANGVTVMCSDADSEYVRGVGQTGEVNGIVYTKRSQSQIKALVAREDSASLTTTCTSGVTGMGFMFNYAKSFNGDISSWDVSSVTDMEDMFYEAESFNQDLSGWCVSPITSSPTNFDNGATSWVRPRPVWGTCPS